MNPRIKERLIDFTMTTAFIVLLILAVSVFKSAFGQVEAPRMRERQGVCYVADFGANGINATAANCGFTQAFINANYGLNFINANTQTIDFAATKKMFQYMQDKRVSTCVLSTKSGFLYLNDSVKLPQINSGSDYNFRTWLIQGSVNIVCSKGGFYKPVSAQDSAMILINNGYDIRDIN